jgi:hypothetical protein
MLGVILDQSGKARRPCKVEVFSRPMASERMLLKGRVAMDGFAGC